IDGNVDDWQGIPRYIDEEFILNPDINISEYSLYYENEKVYFYAKVSGSLFSGASNGYDTLLIFVDADGDSNSGYRIENLGADARIEVSGYDGEIRSASVSKFIEGTHSTKPELNYSAWENAGEVRVEKAENLVEGYAKIGGLTNPVSLVLMRHYESNTFAEKRGMALVGKEAGSLVIYQNFVAGDLVNADEDVLELKLIAKGKGVHVEGVSVENATVDLPKKDLEVDEELTVRCRAKSLSDGNAYGFAVSGVNTNVPYRIVGSGGKAYFGSLPSGIVIDGAFGDWQGVEKGSDAIGDAPKNIDLKEYASKIETNAYFYMAVDGTMVAGCEIPVLGARPPVQPGPITPAVVKENLGLDIARVYIDLVNSTVNPSKPAMIQHGYLIELQGRNGQVISAKAWKWENGVKADEIQNPEILYGLNNGRIELSVGLDTLSGISPSSRFYFEMSNWLGEEDFASVGGFGPTRVGGDGGYGSTEVTEFTGSYNNTVLVNDRYTSTTKGALRLENNTVQYGGPGAPAPPDGNLTVSGTVYWNGTYYFRHLKIASTGNITANGYMTVIRIYAEVIEIEAGGMIYLAGKGGQGGYPGAANGGDGTSGQNGNDGTGPGGNTPPNADGGGGGGGLITNNNYGGHGGGGGAFAGNGGTGGDGAKDGTNLGNGGDPGVGGSAYASEGVLKLGSGGGGGSGGDGAGSAAGGAGGSGGGAVLLNAWNIYINGRIIANGTNGGNGANGDRPGAGGGGGSGGCILIQGCNVTIGSNAELNASGGNGGNAGDDTTGSTADDEAGGGGGGGGGAIWIYADNAYFEAETAIFNVSGGRGGLGSVGTASPLNNNGVDGSDGNITKPTHGTPPSPRTTFISNFSYALTGYYVSPVLDAGRISLWRSISWTRDTHWLGTQVVLRVRWGNTSWPDGTWHAWLDVNGTMSGDAGPITESFNLSPIYPFARFFQYNITLSTSNPSNSPTIYSVNIIYSKPKLLITSVIFNPSPLGSSVQKVILFNNDTFPVNYTRIYLNSSASYFQTPLSLAPGTSITVDLSPNFFQPVNDSGDFLFLNDSSSGIPGVSPNGIVDFVNWTDRNGGEPPSCGNHAALQGEWSNGPVNLNGFDPLTQTGINRNVILDFPVDTDTKTDWKVTVDEQTTAVVLALQMILLFPLVRRKVRLRKP
ncbi:MAG: hypothetical protein QXD15_02880, partial [Thermoplasmata archaeon]